MKTITVLLFGNLLALSGCEDKAGAPETLSRPTIPDHRGINPADTTLTYNSEFKESLKYENEHNNGNSKYIKDSVSSDRY